MVFLPFPAEAKSLARAIRKFQYDTGNKKASRIESTLQELVDHIDATEPINLPLRNITRKKTRTAASASSYFYDSSWFIDTGKFPEAIARFEELIADSRTMDSALQQSITSVVTSAVATAVVAIQTKHESEMLFLHEMIEKSLFLKDSSLTTLPPNPNSSAKMSTPPDNPTKTAERWNQADLGYFDPHPDKAHGEEEIVSVGKNIYYKNVVLFVQRLQSLATFKGAALVKANIATSLRGSALEWYISKLSDFDGHT